MSLIAHLTELSVINPPNLTNLAAVFEQCAAIRSFTFCDKARYDGQEATYANWSNEEFIDILGKHPNAFPHLTSFKLMGAWFWSDQIEAVATFLKSKTSLRRLDVMNDKWTRWDGDGIVDDWIPLLQILDSFPHLECLGIDMRGAQLTPEDMQQLQRHIPCQLTAFLLTIFAESSKATADHWKQLVSDRFSPCLRRPLPYESALHQITNFESLRYLHILSVYGHERRDIEAILSHPSLASLELFGYNYNMYWLSPPHTSPTTIAISERWPYPRVQFRTRDDFGNDDWEWLLRHHGEDNEDVFCEFAV